MRLMSDMIRNMSVAGLAIILGVAGVAGPAAGQEGTLARLQETGRVVAGFYNQVIHNQALENGQGYTGVDYEIAVAALTPLGIEHIDQIAVEWAGLLPGLAAKRWDLLAVGMSITEERKKQALFSDPIYRYGAALIVPEGNPKGIEGLDDLSGKRAGAILGSTSAREIEAVPGAALVPYKTHADLIIDLVAGRIDAGFSDEMYAAYFQAENPEPVEFLTDYQGYERLSSPSGMVFRLDDTDLADAVNNELRRLKADGTILAILQKYGLSEANLIP